MVKQIRKKRGISKVDREFLENFKLAAKIVLKEDKKLLEELAKK